MKKIFGFGMFFVMAAVLLAASVIGADTAPKISGTIGDKSVNEGQLLTFTVATTGPDVGAFNNFTICNAGSATGTCTGSHSNGLSTVTLATTQANSTNVSNTQAQFNWTPGFTEADTYYVRFSVSDEDSSDAQNFKIVVADVPPTLIAGTLTMGGSSQERSNPLAEEVRDRNVNVTGVVTLTNTGAETIKNVAFSTITGLGKYTSAFTNANSHSVKLTATELAPGASTTATVELRVPANLDAVNSNFVESAFPVATVTFSGTKSDGATAITPASSTANMRAKNMLEFKNGKLSFKGTSEKLRDGKTVDKLKPDMELSLDIEVESNFKDRDQVDIEDVRVIVRSTGDSDDLDVDDDYDFDTLGTEDTDSASFDFTIEEDAKRGKEELLITLEGIDENGARHGERWLVDLDIEREDHEIAVTSAALSPTAVSCQDSATLNVLLRNTGRSDEEDVFLRVFASEIGSFQRNIELGDLDENDESSQSLTIPVPENLAAGTYRITLETYYDVGKKSVSDAVQLTKIACQPTTSTPQPVDTPPDTSNVVVVPVSGNSGNQAPPPVVVQPPAPVPPAETKGFLETPAYVALLALGYIVVIGGLLVVAIKLLRK